MEKLNINASNENAVTAFNPYRDVQQQQTPCRSSTPPDQSRPQEQSGSSDKDR